MTGRAGVLEELSGCLAREEWSDADWVLFKLFEILIWSTATCADASNAKFGRWIVSSSGAICIL